MNIKNATVRQPKLGFDDFLWYRGESFEAQINADLVERVVIRRFSFYKTIIVRVKRPWYLGGGLVEREDTIDDGVETLFAHHMSSGEKIYLDKNIIE